MVGFAQPQAKLVERLHWPAEVRLVGDEVQETPVSVHLAQHVPRIQISLFASSVPRCGVNGVHAHNLLIQKRVSATPVSPWQRVAQWRRLLSDPQLCSPSFLAQTIFAQDGVALPRSIAAFLGWPRQPCPRNSDPPGLCAEPTG